MHYTAAGGYGTREASPEMNVLESGEASWDRPTTFQEASISEDPNCSVLVELIFLVLAPQNYLILI